MAQRPGSGPGNARKRPTPTKVSKPFPWGTVAISTVLVLFLGGILAYAVTHQGEGFVDPREKLESIKGVAKAEGELKGGHVPTRVTYEQRPPNHGEHNPTWQNCGIYQAPIADEHAVHALEHGAVWITYQPDLPKSEIDKLTELAEGGAYRLLSPYPGQKAKINASAWGYRLTVDSASDERLEDFVDVAERGPQTPEPGAACTGGTSATGPLRGEITTPINPQPNGSAPAPAASR